MVGRETSIEIQKRPSWCITALLEAFARLHPTISFASQEEEKNTFVGIQGVSIEYAFNACDVKLEPKKLHYEKTVASFFICDFKSK